MALSDDRLAAIRSRVAETTTAYTALGSTPSQMAQDREHLLDEVERLNAAVQLLGRELQRGSQNLIDTLVAEATDRDTFRDALLRLQAVVEGGVPEHIAAVMRDTSHLFSEHGLVDEGSGS